jgi:hypothetical protein
LNYSSILRSSLDTERVDDIGSRRSSQHQHDHHSHTSLREAVQRKTRKLSSSHISSSIYLIDACWAERDSNSDPL